MKHPFLVGGKYHNNRGLYEVLATDGENMTIRYDDGTVQSSEVALQKRIWERINADPLPPPVPTPPIIKPRIVKPAFRFEGLKESDFKRTVGGTHWRAKDQLGGELWYRLNLVSTCRFKSKPVYRRADVYFSEPEQLETNSFAAAKFAFELCDTHARYGLCIEKNDEEMDDSWDWARLLRALANDAALQATVQKAMRTWGVACTAFVRKDEKYFAGMHVVAASDRMEIIQPDLKVVDEPWADLQAWIDMAETEQRWQPSNWRTILDWLGALDRKWWCDLYFYRHMVRSDAVALGPRIADAAVDVYKGLLPLYEATKGGVS